jgi:hypothetical protein
MDNPLRAFARKYFKLPDAWYGLAILGGLCVVDAIFINRVVIKNEIFGRDGRGGTVLECFSRIDHHEAEYREGRKKWYYHQRRAKFYMPQDFQFNDKLDYETLSYGRSHENRFIKPGAFPGHHDPDGYYFNDIEADDLKAA